MSVPPPPAPLSPTHCPNCGTPWPADASVCPHCGFVRPAVPAWPPPPEGRSVPPVPSASGLVTGSVTGDILLGLGLGVVSFFFAGLGLVVAPIAYFVLRRPYPVFARGLGFGWLGGTAMVLGLFAICALDQAQINSGK